MWIGADDVITGPVDEIIVFGTIALISAIEIQQNNKDIQFSDAFREAFFENINKLSELLSKKDKEKNKFKDESAPTKEEGSKEKPKNLTPPGAGRRGALREAKR